MEYILKVQPTHGLVPGCGVIAALLEIVLFQGLGRHVLRAGCLRRGTTLRFKETNSKKEGPPDSNALPMCRYDKLVYLYFTLGL